MYTHSKLEMRTRVFKDKTLQHSHETVNVRGVYDNCEKVVSNLRQEHKLQLSERRVLRNNWMQSVMKYKILIKLKQQVFNFNVSHQLLIFQLDVTCYFISLLICSTRFGH